MEFPLKEEDSLRTFLNFRLSNHKIKKTKPPSPKIKIPKKPEKTIFPNNKPSFLQKPEWSYSKLWDRALSNHDISSQIPLWPKSIMEIIIQTLEQKNDLENELKTLFLSVKTPSKEGSFEKKIEKMRSLNKNQEVLIERVLQERWSASQNMDHFQECVGFSKTIQLLNTHFKEFFQSVCPIFSVLPQENSYSEQFFNWTQKYMDFSKNFVEYCNFQNAAFPTSFDITGMMNNNSFESNNLKEFNGSAEKKFKVECNQDFAYSF